jgi:hypothetical protein
VKERHCEAPETVKDGVKLLYPLSFPPIPTMSFALHLSFNHQIEYVNGYSHQIRTPMVIPEAHHPTSQAFPTVQTTKPPLSRSSKIKRWGKGKKQKQKKRRSPYQPSPILASQQRKTSEDDQHLFQSLLSIPSCRQIKTQEGLITRHLLASDALRHLGLPRLLLSILSSWIVPTSADAPPFLPADHGRFPPTTLCPSCAMICPNCTSFGEYHPPFFLQLSYGAR